MPILNNVHRIGKKRHQMVHILTNGSGCPIINLNNSSNFFPNIFFRSVLPFYVIDGADFVIREGIRTYKLCGGVKTPPHGKRQPRQSFGLRPVYSIKHCCSIWSTCTMLYFFNSLSDKPVSSRVFSNRA